jgi:hypothetical protein
LGGYDSVDEDALPLKDVFSFRVYSEKALWFTLHMFQATDIHYMFSRNLMKEMISDIQYMK